MGTAHSFNQNAQSVNRAIAFIWRTAVVITLVIQLFIMALRTPLGKRTVPDLLVRAGFLRAAQKEQLVTFLFPPGFDRVSTLAEQIRLGLPASEPIEIVYSDEALMTAVEDLRYQLYPRAITERPMAGDDISQPGCRIYWQLQADIRIACAAWMPARQTPSQLLAANHDAS